MANIVKAKLRLNKKVKSTMTARWDDSEPLITTDTVELFIGMGETVDAIKISDYIVVDNLPVVGIENKIYIQKSNRQGFYWNGSKFVVIAGQGGVEAFSTYAALPTVGIKDTLYVVKTDEKFYPTTETSIYAWDDFNSKYILVSRAKPTNSFSEIKVDDISLLANNTKDVLTLKAGTGISLTPDPSARTITINQTATNAATIEKKSFTFNGGVKSTTLVNSLGMIGSAIVNDKIYLCGGYNGSIASNAFQCYNPVTNTISSLGTIPSARQNPSVFAYNGNVFMTGGNTGSSILKEFWMYDTSLDSWVAKPNMNIARNGSFKALIGNKFWMIGGSNTTSTCTGAIEYYDFALEGWSLLDLTYNMPTPRNNGSTFVFGDKIYCCGGHTGSAYSLKVEVFDTTNLTWTTLSDMPVNRYGGASDTYNGLGYIFAGSQAGTFTKTLYVYNPDIDTWYLKENMTTARNLPTVQRYDNTFYVLGGMASAASTVNTIDAYSVATAKVSNLATVSMLHPTGTTMLNCNTGETSRYLGLIKDEIWHYGAWNANDFQAIITEAQS